MSELHCSQRLGRLVRSVFPQVTLLVSIADANAKVGSTFRHPTHHFISNGLFLLS